MRCVRSEGISYCIGFRRTERLRKTQRAHTHPAPAQEFATGEGQEMRVRKTHGQLLRPASPRIQPGKVARSPNLSRALAHERFQIFPPIADELADGERIDVVSRAYRNDLFAVTIAGAKAAITLCVVGKGSAARKSVRP